MAFAFNLKSPVTTDYPSQRPTDRQLPSERARRAVHGCCCPQYNSVLLKLGKKLWRSTKSSVGWLFPRWLVEKQELVCRVLVR